MPIAIDVRELSKTFGAARPALCNVSLRIEQGEMVALLGASGSGKSTLLRHLAGFVTSDAGVGSITVSGQSIQQGGRLSRGVRGARQQIGFVFQQFNLVGRSTLITNVMTGMLPRMPLWRSLTGLFRRQELDVGMDALAQVGIEQHAYQRACTLSGGQQQRAAIARTLVQKAKVVLADEPIASLDPDSARRVMETLSKICQVRKVTVVVSLHQVDMALRYCARVVALRHGEVVYDGPSADLTPDMLSTLYGPELDEMLIPRMPGMTPSPVLPAIAPDILARPRLLAA